MSRRYMDPAELSKTPPNLGPIKRGSTQYEELNLLKKNIDRHSFLRDSPNSPKSTSTIPRSTNIQRQQLLNHKSLNNQQIRTLKKLVRDMFSRITTLYAMNYHLYVEQEENKQEILKQKRMVKKKDQALCQITKELGSTKMRESTLKEEMNIQKNELLTQLRSVQELGKKAKYAYEIEREALRNRISNLEREAARLSESVKKFRERQDQQTQLLQSKNEFISKLQHDGNEQKKSTTQRFNEYQKCILEIHKKNEELGKEVHNTEKRHKKEIANIVLEYEEKLEDREATIGRLSKEMEGKARVIEGLTRELESKQEESETLQHQIGHQGEEIETLNSRIRNYFGKIDELDELVDAKEASDQRKKMKKIKKKVKTKKKKGQEPNGKEEDGEEEEKDFDALYESKAVDELHQKLSSSFSREEKEEICDGSSCETTEEEEDEYTATRQQYSPSSSSSSEESEETAKEREYCDRLRSKLEEKERELNTSFEILEKTREELTNKSEQVKELEVMNSQLEQICTRSQDFTESTSKKIDDYSSMYDEKDREVEELRSKLEEKEKEIERLRNKHDDDDETSESDNKSKDEDGNVLERILDLK